MRNGGRGTGAGLVFLRTIRPNVPPAAGLSARCYHPAAFRRPFDFPPTMPTHSARRLLAAAALALLAALAPRPAAGFEAPAEWAVAGGASNVADDERTGAGLVEARWADFHLPLAGRRLAIAPTLGLTANGNGSTYAYLSFRSDVAAALAGLTGAAPPPPVEERRWRFTAFTGLGHYRRGDDGRDLGGPLEFRSGLEVARRLGAASWLGLSLDHKSNAGIYDSNRGSEDLVLVFTWRP